MKIALLLRGSSISSYTHWQFKDKIFVHYKNNFDNIKKHLLDKYDCDVFFHSWKQEGIPDSQYQELVEDYKPQSYMFDDDIDGTYGPPLGKKVALSAKKVIDTFEKYRQDNRIDYDLVIMARFDVYFLQEINLQNILSSQNISNKIFLYTMGPNLNKDYVDKNSTKTQGIDDNFIIFSPNVVANYRDCLDMKEETIATTRGSHFFYPTQHCSLHHLYYLLDDKIQIKNLVNLYPSTNKKSIYGIIKQLDADSVLISQCPPKKKTQIKENLFVIHYE
jgi:hypothetical protein